MHSISTKFVFFIGIVLAMQSAYQLEQMGAAIYVAALVGVSMTREIGPVLTSLVIAGRVGAAITAELSTMKVTEQIDALRTLSVNPIGYLVTPRIIAGMISLPVLGSMSIIATMFGGWIMLSSVHGVDTTTYLMWSQLFLKVRYVWESITKMTVLGGMLLAVSTYHGFYTSGGAVGVGNSTIKSVVTSSFLVILIDYVMSSIFSYIK